MTIEIGKEYIYNNELDKEDDHDECIKSLLRFDRNMCKVISRFDDNKIWTIEFNNDDNKQYFVWEQSLTPIPIVPPQGGTGEVDPNNCSTCEDHDSHDCAICTKNDDSKYKRTWEALPGAIKGKVHPITLKIIRKIMGEVMESEQ